MNDIVIIGTGKIAYSLTSALNKSGYKISCAVSKSPGSAKSFSKRFKISSYTIQISQIPKNAKFYIIAVPDSEIENTAKELSKLKLHFDSSVFVHLSGAHSIQLLKSLKKKGAQIGSFHIMQTFPSNRIVKINGCYAAIETENSSTEKFLFDIAHKLKLIPFKLSSKLKVKYHLAGVFASNFLIANLFNAKTIFNQKDVEIFRVLEPILMSTFQNIKKNGIAKALSGPIDRGDIQTIERHLKSLKGNELSSYILQSLTLLEAVKEKYGKLNEDHLKVEKLVKEKLKKN